MKQNRKQLPMKAYRTLRGLCPRIRNQAALDAILLEVTDPFERKQMFDWMKPHLPFKATFPTPLHTLDLI